MVQYFWIVETQLANQIWLKRMSLPVHPSIAVALTERKLDERTRIRESTTDAMGGKRGRRAARTVAGEWGKRGRITKSH